MNFEQRAAIGGSLILPALKELKSQVKSTFGMDLSDDDLIFASMWAVASHSVQTTGGTAAIEKLRDVLDEIERSGPFGVR